MDKYNMISGFQLSRLEAISDGVFAIAMTLLVLEIKVPVTEEVHSEQQLITAFLQLSPKFGTYFLSFITLGIYWLAHATQFHYIRSSNRGLNWINLFFLLSVSVLPFTTAFLGEFSTFKFPLFIYWVNLSSLGLLLGLNWFYARKHKLLKMEQDAVATRPIKRRVIESQILYTLATALGFVNVHLSIGLLTLIQLNYALALFSFRRKERK